MSKLYHIYQASTRSHFVANSLNFINEFYLSKDMQNKLLQELSIQAYIDTMIPKFNLGRRFGHTYGVAEYIKNNIAATRSNIRYAASNIASITSGSCGL